VLYRLAADVIVVVHALFVVFVVLGGLTVLRWPRLAWLHLPVAAWGALIEFGGWICPLTPFEKWLRLRAGEAAYEGGFIEHYLLPILYPPGLTRQTQIVLGLIVLAINLVIYGYLLRRWAARRRQSGP
jgi:hypothetical protein